ncbi:ABC transporter ATP-binding protein [Oryzicola mucosus]|uniref:ABC transporter ATP-binding protein n=1 Tax=Oryzicola mucosus TaxID=2767425 RepID=UPI001AEE33B2|nr:ABC transporter ATP-binding protein [Oryzicola mucosus]
MVAIDIDNAAKSYAGKRVLDGVSMRIDKGEFVAILGPSGCGKTTLLRLLAGFEKLDDGSIALGGVEVSNKHFTLPPEKRNVGIVFQNYALWPHMSVGDNVGYALKIAGVGSSERKRKSLDALDAVGMRDLSERAPADLSGGQRQRVALARCLAANPSVMLLDEPLANLDVHLRASMEKEFLGFHKRTGATMLYITHDQSEAMALADRIAVMDKGRLVQFARPHELYREPRDEMVARFIGNGLILPASSIAAASQPGQVMAEVFGTPHRVRAPLSGRAGAQLSVHPNDLALANDDGEGFSATVERVVYRGSHNQVDFHPDAMPELSLTLHAPLDRAVAPGHAISVRIDDGWVIPAAA